MRERFLQLLSCNVQRVFAAAATIKYNALAALGEAVTVIYSSSVAGVAVGNLLLTGVSGAPHGFTSTTTSSAECIVYLSQRIDLLMTMMGSIT